MQESDGHDEMSNAIIQSANPPLEIHTFYSVNEIEALQTLGKYAFTSQYETDEILQKNQPD